MKPIYLERTTLHEFFQHHREKAPVLIDQDLPDMTPADRRELAVRLESMVRHHGSNLGGTKPGQVKGLALMLNLWSETNLVDIAKLATFFPKESVTKSFHAAPVANLREIAQALGLAHALLQEPVDANADIIKGRLLELVRSDATKAIYLLKSLEVALDTGELHTSHMKGAGGIETSLLNPVIEALRNVLSPGAFKASGLVPHETLRGG